MIIKQYEDEIDKSYTEVETAPIVEFESPKVFGGEESRSYVSQLVKQAMGRVLQDNDDFFLSGCDRYSSPFINLADFLLIISPAA